MGSRASLGHHLVLSFIFFCPAPHEGEVGKTGSWQSQLECQLDSINNVTVALSMPF
jgi:hypothetical protein